MSAKVISLASTKGGNGKSTMSDAIANYLVRQGEKVLLIDLNSQMDLTLAFNRLTKQELKQSSIYNAFSHDARHPQQPFKASFKPVHIKRNLDLLTSSKKLRNVSDLMRNSMTLAPYVLSHIFSKKSGLGLSDKYDYIIIDTHNDTDVPVENAFVISDYILAPVIPSRFGINSVSDTLDIFNYFRNHLLNPMTHQSFVTAKLYFIGNLVKFNTKTSNEFVKAVKNNPRFIALFHELELFNKAQTYNTNIFEFANRNGHRNDAVTLKKRIIPQLEKIVRVVSSK